MSSVLLLCNIERKTQREDGMRHPVLSHIRDHVWLWIVGLLVLGLALGWLGFATPATLLILIAGLLIIIRSQGTDVLTIATTNPAAPDEDEDMSGATRSVGAASSGEAAYR
jgi:hypothetical protein